MNSIETLSQLYLGHQGEHLAQTVEVDIAKLIGEATDYSVVVMVRRKGDTMPYMAAITMEGSVLSWPITSVETEKAGQGQCEIRVLKGGSIVKSNLITIYVDPAIMAQETEVPEVHQGWVEQVTATAAEAQLSANAAAKSAQDAKVAVASVAQIKDDAVGAASTWSSEKIRQESAAFYPELTWNIGYLSSGGTISKATEDDATGVGAFRYSDPIVCAGLSEVSVKGDVANPYVDFVAFYDESGKRIQGCSDLGASSVEEVTVPVPEGAHTCRITATRAQYLSGFSYLKLNAIEITMNVLESDILGMSKDVQVAKAELAKLDMDVRELSSDMEKVNRSFDHSLSVLSGGELLPATGSPYQQYNTSTFSGWGYPIGPAQNFNALRFTVINRSTEENITTIRCAVTIGDKKGEVLADVTRDGYSIAPGEKQEILFSLDAFIANEDGENLFAGYCCDQFVTWRGYKLTLPEKLGAEGSPYALPVYVTNGVMNKAISSWTGISSTPSDKADIVAVNIESVYNLSAKQRQEINDYVDERVDTLAQNIAVRKIDISLPEKYDLVVGDTFELFYRGVLKVRNVENVYVRVVCDIGAAYARKYMVTPTAANVGQHTLTITVYDDGGNTVGVGSVILNVEAAMTTPASMMNVLCMGDSLTAGGAWPDEFYRRLVKTTNTAQNKEAAPTGYGLNNIRFIGKKTTGANGAGYEGFGGWTFNSYLSTSNEGTAYWVTVASHDKTGSDQESIFEDANGTQWQLETIEAKKLLFKKYSGTGTLPTSGTLTWKNGGTSASSITYTSISLESNNPFCYNGTVDFSAYCDDLGVEGIDCCYILLGWNNSGISEATYKGYVRSFLDKMLAFNPKCNVVLMGIQIPSIDGCAVNYGASSNFSYRNLQNFVFNLNRWYTEIAAEYVEAGHLVQFVNVAGQLDSDNCYSTTSMAKNTRVSSTVNVQNNGVHPNVNGYLQIADAAFRHFNNQNN